jgi:hypothetical protein
LQNIENTGDTGGVLRKIFGTKELDIKVFKAKGLGVEFRLSRSEINF